MLDQLRRPRMRDAESILSPFLISSYVMHGALLINTGM